MSRGRKPGFRMSDEHRVKIQNSNILNALIEHIEGKREMSSSQVTAGLGLLKKVLPDITENRLTGEDGGPIQAQVAINVAKLSNETMAELLDAAINEG